MLEIFAHLPLILISLATICFAFQIKVEWSLLIASVATLIMGVSGILFVSFRDKLSIAPTKIVAISLAQRPVRTLLFLVSFGTFQEAFKRSNGEHYFLATVRLWENHPWGVIGAFSLSLISLCVVLGWFNTALLASTVVAPVAFATRELTNFSQLETSYILATWGAGLLISTEAGLRIRNAFQLNRENSDVI